MDKRHFHKLLTALQAELASAPAIDPKDRELLRSIDKDIRAIVAGDAAPAAGYEPLRQRLVGGVARFETSHPHLARALAGIIDTLALYNL